MAGQPEIRQMVVDTVNAKIKLEKTIEAVLPKFWAGTRWEPWWLSWVDTTGSTVKVHVRPPHGFDRYRRPQAEQLEEIKKLLGCELLQIDGLDYIATWNVR